MKCPACWAEKAYKRKTTGIQRIVYACSFLTPLKCHHCYHKFVIPRFLTIGKKVIAPVQISESPFLGKSSYAAKFVASQKIDNDQNETLELPVRKAA